MAKKDVNLNDLAVMIKRGFDEQGGQISTIGKELANFRKENQEEHKDIKLRLSNLEFLMTETVRRDEFLELKKRLELLEAKIG